MKKINRIIEKIIFEPLQGIFAILLYYLFASLKPETASWLGGQLALKISFLLPQNKRAKDNIKLIFPHLPEIKRNKILRETIENLGRNAGEYPHLGRIQEFIKVKGLSNLPKKEKPFILVAAHLANWELTPYPGTLVNRPVMRVYRKLNAPLAEWILRKKKSPLPGEVVPKGNKGAIKMLSVLRSNGIVLLLSDQRLNTGIKINFMGKPANTLTSPAVMSLKLGCPIIPLQIKRNKGLSFDIIIHPALDLAKFRGNHKTKIKNIMIDINKIISSWINQNPGQWFWHHRRWKV